MNTPKTVKKVTALALAFTVLTGTGLKTFIPDAVNPTSSAIVVSAASSSDKLSGESRVYISNLWKGEICIRVNTKAQIENLKNFLKALRDHSTSTKNLAALAASKLPIPGGMIPQQLLKALIKAVNTDGVQRSAKKALSEIDKLTKNSPSKGIRIYMSTSDWKVYTQ